MILTFLRLWQISMLQNLWRHQRHYCVLKITLLFIQNPRWYQNEISWDIKATYDKYFQFLLSSEVRKQDPGPYMISIKWQHNAICEFLKAHVNYFSIASAYTSKRVKKHILVIIGLSLLAGGQQIKKDLDIGLSLLNNVKYFLKNAVHVHIYQLNKFHK